MTVGIPVERMWEIFGPWRAAVAAAPPNAAHTALVSLERAALARGARFTVLAQNVDALHSRAGQASVVELHGRLCRTRCPNLRCKLEAFEDETPHAAAPRCQLCNSRLRPDIVLFGEQLGLHESSAARRAFREVDLFVAIGTSGTVWPAASFIEWAGAARAHSVLVNLTALDGSGEGFERVLLGPAEEVVPQLVPPEKRKPADDDAGSLA
jgi:NAD-dependent deacetylase